MDLGAFFDEFFHDRLIAIDVRQETVSDYRRVAFSAPNPLDEDSAVRWLSQLPGSPATRNKYRRYLLCMLLHARRKGLVGDWIRNLPKAKESKLLPRAWTVEEFSQLLEAAGSVEESYNGVPGNLWWRSLLLSLWYTGCRVQSMLDVRTDDVDIANGTIVVESQKDRRQMLYLLPDDASRAMRRIGWRREMMWPWPWADRKKTLLRRLRQIIFEADLPQLATPFHAIRRSVASYVANKLGVAVACDVIGHSRMSTTQRHYIDPRICCNARKAASVMPSPKADFANRKRSTQ